MTGGNLNSDGDSIQFNNLYAVEFNSQRVMRPESTKFVIGRHESSDFVVTSQKVADKHCEISCSGHSWRLHNLSPKETSLVGIRALQNDTVELIMDKTILKLGGVYIQSRTEVESSQPPLRILKLIRLIGSRCYLTGVPENLPDEPIQPSEQENTDDSMEVPPQVDSAEVITAEGGNAQPEVAAENGHVNGEYNTVINSMAIESTKALAELSEMKQALKKALLEKSDLECILAELQDQLSSHTETSRMENAMAAVVENELQCTICNEVLFDAVTLDCSHSYCDFCLQQWKRTPENGALCPICRKQINHECKTRIIDSLIEKIVEKLGDDTQKQRLQFLVTRRGRNC